MSENSFVTTLVPIDKIKPPMFQCRGASLDENLDELVESVKTVGLLQPITIRKDKEEQLELVLGSRRLKACQKAGLTLVPAIIRDLTDEEALEIEGSENLNRNDLSPEEKTRLVSEWAKRGYDAKGITEKVHKGYSWVLSFLPAEFKNKEMSELGKLGAESRAVSVKERDLHVATEIVANRESQDTKILDTVEIEEKGQATTVSPSTVIYDVAKAVECERCHVKTREPKVWHGHDLCHVCEERANNNPDAYDGYLRTQERGKAKLIPEIKVVTPSSFESYADKEARMKTPHSRMEEKIVNGLRARGYTVETDIPVVVKEIITIPDFNIILLGQRTVRGYVDGVVHNGKRRDKDEELRLLLKKRFPNDIIVAVDVKGDSDKEADEKIEEIVEATKW
jgi:ParB family chromosome partitioning protein